jgi:hypothetical protein
VTVNGSPTRTVLGVTAIATFGTSARAALTRAAPGIGIGERPYVSPQLVVDRQRIEV